MSPPQWKRISLSENSPKLAEGAALLVDHVLPEVGYRQWVLSFTGPMAVRLGYDRELLAAVSGRLARAVLQDIRRAVKREYGLASVASLHGGVVTVVQRFRSDLGLYVHLHLLVTDGAFEERGDELPFRPALQTTTSTSTPRSRPASSTRCEARTSPVPRPTRSRRRTRSPPTACTSTRRRPSTAVTAGDSSGSAATSSARPSPTTRSRPSRTAAFGCTSSSPGAEAPRSRTCPSTPS